MLKVDRDSYFSILKDKFINNYVSSSIQRSQIVYFQKAPFILIKSTVQFPGCLSPLHWRWNVMTDIITFLHSPLLTMLRDSLPASSLLSPLQTNFSDLQVTFPQELYTCRMFDICEIELSSQGYVDHTIITISLVGFIVSPNFSTMSDNRIFKAFFSDFQVN